MNECKLGIAIIINNINKEMPSSSRDVQTLVETYEKIGFEVQKYNDCNERVSLHDEIDTISFFDNRRSTMTLWLNWKEEDINIMN